MLLILSNRSNAGFPSKAFHPPTGRVLAEKMGELPKSSTYPYSSAPLSLSFSLSLFPVQMSIHQAEYSFRGNRFDKVSSQFAQHEFGVSDIPRCGKRLPRVYPRSPREKRIHRLFPKYLETRCRASKQASNRGCSRAIDFTQPPTQLAWEGGEEREDATPSLSRSDYRSTLRATLDSTLNEN